MNRKLSLQIVSVVLVAGIFVGFIGYSDVYETVENVIVRVTCLSCLKLDPRTALEINFETATGEGHPSFVLDNISKGPIFIAYRADACAACEIMEPIVMDIFDVEFGVQETFKQVVTYNDMNITFYHINIDHAQGGYRRSFDIYDKDFVAGVPMFTMITLGYDRGVIKPAYVTTYGTLNLDTNQQREDLLRSIIADGILLYQENVPGHPH